jgi:hypothetical protein
MSWIAGLWLALMAAMAASLGAAEEEEVTLDQVPAPAKTVIQNEAKAAKIETLMRITDGPKTTFVAVWAADGKETQLEVDPEGKVLRKEAREQPQDVTLDQVPAPVKAALLKEAGDTKVGSIVRMPEEGKPTFVAEIATEQKSVEIKLDAEGKLLWKAVREKLSLDQTPEPVRTAVEKQGQGLKVEMILRTVEDAKTQFNAVLTGEGKELQLELDPQGKVLAKHASELLLLDKTPDPVKAAIQKELAGGKVESIERMTEDEQVEYIARLTVNRKMIELVIDPTGKILSKETNEAEEEAKEPPAKK